MSSEISDSKQDILGSKGVRERQYQCDICQLGFRKHQDLVHHQKLHVGVKPYLCGMCNKGFTEISEYKAHTKDHANDKNFPCKSCEMSFSTKSCLMSHEVTHLCSIRPTQLRYPERSTSVKTPKEKVKSRKVSSKKRCLDLILDQYSCSFCGENFFIEYELHLHLLEHLKEQEQNHTCPICKERFSSNEMLLSHKREHFCSKAFLSKLAKIQ